MQTISYRGREDKLVKTAALFAKYLEGRVLDVGCDMKHLKKFVKGSYIGVDICDAADMQIDANEGLPFEDGTFDCVTAFDILEHLEKAHFVANELFRVSRRYVVIALPNIYEWSFRTRFLCSGTLGAKYGLPLNAPADRHRWIFNLDEAKNFIADRAKRNRFNVVEEVCGYMSYHRLLARLIQALGKSIAPRAASFFVYRYWAVLERENRPPEN